MLNQDDFNNPQAKILHEASDDASVAGDFESADRLAMAAIAMERGDEGTAELWLESLDKKIRQRVERLRAAAEAVAA